MSFVTRRVLNFRGEMHRRACCGGFSRIRSGRRVNIIIGRLVNIRCCSVNRMWIMHRIRTINKQRITDRNRINLIIIISKRRITLMYCYVYW